MRKKNSQTKLQRIDEILSRALKKRRVPFRSEDRRLLDIWLKAAGPQIASQCRPESLRRDVLFVKVSSPVWMHQLHFLKGELIEKVNALMEKTSVKDIRFSIGQLPSSEGIGKDAAAPPLSTDLLKERDKKMMEACLASLKDEELRDILKRVMTREITQRRFRERKAP